MFCLLVHLLMSADDTLSGLRPAFMPLGGQTDFCIFFFIPLSERPWLVDSYDQWLERLKVRLILLVFTLTSCFHM